MQYVVVYNRRTKGDKLGNGYRRVLLLTQGSKWTTVFCPFTCVQARMYTEDYLTSLVEEVTIGKHMVKILAANMKAFDDTSKRSQKVLKDLKELTKKVKA
jgi:hypothetical protein